MYDDPRLYDRRTEHLVDDVGLFRREAARCGEPVLELACGTGRVAVALARQGFRVVGLDLDRGMLTRARERAAEAGVDVAWVCADMTRFETGPHFRLVYVAFASLHDLPAPADWERCLRCAARALLPGGGFVLDDHAPPFGTGGRAQHVRLPEGPAGGAVDAFQTVEVDERTQTTRGEIVYQVHEADGGRAVRRYPFRGSWALPDQVEAMMARAGLRPVDRQGDYAGTPWREGSPRTIFRAVRE